MPAQPLFVLGSLAVVLAGAVAGETAVASKAGEGSSDDWPRLSVTENFNGGRSSWANGQGDVLVAWTLTQSGDQVFVCGAFGVTDPAMVETAQNLLAVAWIKDAADTKLIAGLSAFSNAGTVETLTGVDATCAPLPGGTSNGRYRFGIDPE